MRALIVLGMLASVVSAHANSPHNRQREQITIREVNQYLYGQNQITPITQLLALPESTLVNSLVLIVSSDDGRGYARIIFNGRPLFERYVGASLEVFQIPVNAQLGHRRELALQTSGSVYLASIGATFNGNYNNPNPSPVPPAVPGGAACELTGYGPYNGYNWAYRIKVAGAVMESANSLDLALDKVRKLVDARLCSVGVQPQSSELLGYGPYKGFNWAYRLTLGGELLESSNSLDALVQASDKLRTAGLAQPDPRQRCGVLPAGPYKGYNWSHRVTIGERIVDASNSLDAAVQVMNSLRSAGFCY